MVLVDLTPQALRTPRGVALQERGVVVALADAVDPAPAQSDVERLGGRDRRVSRALLVDPDPDLGLTPVMRRQPGLECRAGLERLGLFRIRNDGSHTPRIYRAAPAHLRAAAGVSFNSLP